MTIRELMTLLNTCDPNAEVFVQVTGSNIAELGVTPYDDTNGSFTVHSINPDWGHNDMIAHIYLGDCIRQ